MKTIYAPFIVLTLTSLWEPIDASTLYSKVYKIYRYIGLTCHIFCVTGEAIYAIVLLVQGNNFQASNEALFIVLTGLLILFKSITTIVKRQKICRVINDLENKPCASEDQQENEIITKCENNLR